VSSKHIAVITPGFAKDEADTDCIPVLQHFVLELQNQGYLVTVIALHYPYRKETYTWNSIQVVALNGANSRFKRQFTLYGQLKKAIINIHQQRPISVIHPFWLNETTYFSARIAKKLAIPIVATALGQDVLPENRYLKPISTFNLLVFCISDFHLQQLNKTYFPLAKSINLGTTKSSVMTKTIDIVGVGSFIPLKNYSYFIRVCAEIKTTRPDFTAVIVGSGSELKLLQSLIQELRLEKNIQLVGQLPYLTTLNYIGSARVLMHASSFEGMGMILLEALAHGTHVLSSPVGFAMNAPEIEKLSFDLKADGKKLLELLDAPTPVPIFHSISTTIEAYNAIYAGL